MKTWFQEAVAVTVVLLKFSWVIKIRRMCDRKIFRLFFWASLQTKIKRNFSRVYFLYRSYVILSRDTPYPTIWHASLLVFSCCLECS